MAYPDKAPNKKPFIKHNTTPKAELKDMIFGIQTVLETIRAGKEIEKILILRELGNIELTEFARIKGIPTQKVPKEKLDKITRKNHQGVIAFVSSVNYANIDNIVADVFEKGEVPFILVLDRITDVRNFGAIARTAECAGIHAIVVPARESAQISSDAMKTSSGALNFIPVCRENNLATAVANLQKSGLQVIACTEKAKSNMYEHDYTLPTAIVMGSEDDGISDEILRLADGYATIPQLGRVGSLNVSVASGIILYEAIRQKNIIIVK